MDLNSEINRLLDVMPASGRMQSRIISKPEQPQILVTPFPLPWNRGDRPVYINFDLWQKLSRGQRDLLILSIVSRSLAIKWFKPDWYQAITLAGLLGFGSELIQADAIGIVISGGLTAIAASQIWRNNRSLQQLLTADEAAIKIATRRGYTVTEAAKHLLEAIENAAKIEGRPSLDFNELIRTQNLKAIGNLSNIGIPKNVREE
ncbi:MAG: DUF3318 domain-containing protein [Prochloraceae cyanobacterium]|nr:DUF3318 domain-containing protein [Prochloraceae cyanobacterium]